MPSLYLNPFEQQTFGLESMPAKDAARLYYKILAQKKQNEDFDDRPLGAESLGEAATELYRTGKDFATMTPTIIAQRILEPTVGGARALGTLSAGGNIDQAAQDYMSGVDAAREMTSDASQRLFGQPSQLMQVASEKLFEPMLHAAETSGGRPGREAAQGLMDTTMMLPFLPKSPKSGTGTLSNLADRFVPREGEAYSTQLGKTAQLAALGTIAQQIGGTDPELLFPLIAGSVVGEKARKFDKSKAYFDGLDGHYKMPVSDKAMGINTTVWENQMQRLSAPNRSVTQVKYSDLVDHPELLENYPVLGDVTVELSKRGKPGTGEHDFTNNKIVLFGADKLTNPQAVRELIAHEGQHHIQALEGFNLGTSDSIVPFEHYLRKGGEWESNLAMNNVNKDIADWDWSGADKRVASNSHYMIEVPRKELLEVEQLSDGTWEAINKNTGEILSTGMKTRAAAVNKALSGVTEFVTASTQAEAKAYADKFPGSKVKTVIVPEVDKTNIAPQSVALDPQQAYNSNIKPQEGRYVTQDDAVRPDGSTIDSVADSTQQAAVQRPSEVNNRTLQVREPEAAQRWSTVNGQPVKPVSIDTVDMRNPKPGVVLVHSSQVPGLDIWDPSKASAESYTGKNISKGFWGATEEGANLHGEVRPENVTEQYLIRTENPISIKYDGGPKTQAAMIAARDAGHDVAFLYDDLGNRNVVHLKPEEGGVKNVKNTGEWSESPSMLHNWILPVTAATAALFADDDRLKALGLAGTMTVIPKSVRLKELQAKLREAKAAGASPAEIKALGQQITAVMQEGKQPTTATVEKPLINPEGPTFQLKSLNLINQLKPEMKLNGPQLEKYLRERGVSKDEISSVFGDIKNRGIIPANRWASMAERDAPKINVDVYGGKSRTEKPYVIQTGDNEFTVYDPDTHTELMTSSTMEGARTYANSVNLGPSKPAIYQSWFKDDIAKFGSDHSTYQVAQLGVELPSNFVEDPRSVQELEATKDALIELELNYRRDNGLNREQSYLTEEGRYFRDTINDLIHQINYKERGYDINQPSWKNEHGEIDTPNSLAGFITSETKLPSGETVTVMYEGQPAKPVREQALSVEATARKIAAERDTKKWEELPEDFKDEYRKLAQQQKSKNPVPEPLAERAMELAAKQMIAQAREAGHAGILLQTGPEIAKRWNLTNWFDEARYNPETQMLSMYKNGQVKIEPRHVPPEKLGETLNSQELADRLLATQINDKPDVNWAVNNSTLIDKIVADRGVSFRNAMQIAWDENPSLRTKVGEHVLEDLSIDKPWTTIEYGQFEGGKYIPGKVANTLKRLTGGEIELIDIAPSPREWRKEDNLIVTDGFHIAERGGSYDVFDIDSHYVDSFPTLEEAKQFIEKETSPSSKGSFKQPFLRFTKDTPKTFSIYEWAAMTGLSAAIIKRYMDASDENKKKMLAAFPALGMINLYHAGANIPTSKLNRRTYWSANKTAVEKGYLPYPESNTGESRILHVASADLKGKKAAKDSDVEKAAIKVGYDPEEVETLTPATLLDENYFGSNLVSKLENELLKNNFDYVLATDVGMDTYSVFKAIFPLKEGFIKHQP